MNDFRRGIKKALFRDYFICCTSKRLFQNSINTRRSVVDSLTRSQLAKQANLI